MPLVFFVYNMLVCAKLIKKVCVICFSGLIVVVCWHQSFDITMPWRCRAVLREEGGMRQHDGRSHRY